MPQALFWFLYTFACIWLHSFVPGLDCFAPALIVCLHLKRYRSVCWLAPVWLLINEGLGSMAFGASIVWYAGLMLFFFAVQVFFSTRHLYFVFVLALFAACWHYFVFVSMINLQELRVPKELVIMNSLFTACAFPVAWRVIQWVLKPNGTWQYVQR